MSPHILSQRRQDPYSSLAPGNEDTHLCDLLVVPPSFLEIRAETKKNKKKKKKKPTNISMDPHPFSHPTIQEHHMSQHHNYGEKDLQDFQASERQRYPL